MDFRVFLGSVAGPYHVKNNIPNQDALLFHEESGYMFAAVADGAGSLKFSDMGAHEAVSEAVFAMEAERRNLTPIELVKLGMEKARTAVLRRNDYKQFGSTLTLIAWHKDGYGAVGALGDSFAVLHGEEGTHELVTGTPLGEYANITELLTSDEINPVYSEFEGITGISLSSDGLEGVAIQDKKAHDGFWAGIIPQAESGRLDIDKLFRWLNSLDKLVDDTSLLTMVRA